MKNNQKGFIGITLAIIALIALGAGGYIVYKNKTSAPVPVTMTEVGVPENKEEEAGSIPTEVAATSSTKASSTTSANTTQAIGDYEVRVLTPIANKTFYVGDTIDVVVILGKNISQIFMVNVGIDSNFEKNTTITKNTNSTYSVRYHIEPGNAFFLGPSTFQVQGLINPNMTERLTREQLRQASVSIPIILDSKSTPIKMEAETPLTIKIGPHTTPTGPLVAIEFADKRTAVSLDQSLVKYTISDPSIVSIREIIYDPLGTGSNVKTIDLLGNKIGTTTLTVTYKNLSKTITVNIVN